MGEPQALKLDVLQTAKNLGAHLNTVLFLVYTTKRL